MSATVDECPFTLGVGSPKNKYKMLFFFGENADSRICKCFPTSVLVRTGLVCTYGEGSIEQQYALLCPACQIAGSGGISANVIFYFLENIKSGRRERNTVIYGETKSVCLSRTMIGVLTDYHDFYFVKRA